MIRESQLNTFEEPQSFLRKKQKSSSSSSSFQKSASTSRLEKRRSSEVSSIVSTRDLNSSFDDFTTFDGLNDHSPAAVYHESLFAQSMFSNTKSHDDPFDLEEFNQNFLFYDSYVSLDENNYEDQNEKEGNEFHFINFPQKINDNSSVDVLEDISSLIINGEQELSEKPQKRKEIRFKITKKGRKKLSTKPKKINKSLPPKIQCGHCNCSNIFYTDKQHSRHHNKFSPLCTKDSVTLIKLVSKTKRILHHLRKQEEPHSSVNNIQLQSIKDKYSNFVKFVPQRDQFNYISGSQFDDCLTEDDDDDANCDGGNGNDEHYTDYKSQKD